MLPYCVVWSSKLMLPFSVIVGDIPGRLISPRTQWDCFTERGRMDQWTKQGPHPHLSQGNHGDHDYRHVIGGIISKNKTVDNALCQLHMVYVMAFAVVNHVLSILLFKICIGNHFILVFLLCLK